MTLQQLRYFIKLAEIKNFTQAADELYISQPSLSYAIKELENILDVSLFDRTDKKNLKLSSYGEVFLPYAQTVLKTLDSASDAISVQKKRAEKQVVVAYTHTINNFLMVDFWAAFQEHNLKKEIPLQFSIYETQTTVVDSIIAEKADLALTCCLNEKINAEFLALLDIVLLLPQNHPLASREKVSLEEVRDEIFIMCSHSSFMHDHAIKMFEYHGISPNILMSLDNFSTRLSYISQGDGIALSFRLKQDTVPNIAMVPVDSPLGRVPLYLASQKGTQLSQNAKLVANFFLKYFAEKNYII